MERALDIFSVACVPKTCGKAKPVRSLQRRLTETCGRFRFLFRSKPKKGGGWDDTTDNGCAKDRISNNLQQVWNEWL